MTSTSSSTTFRSPQKYLKRDEDQARLVQSAVKRARDRAISRGNAFAEQSDLATASLSFLSQMAGAGGSFTGGGGYLNSPLYNGHGLGHRTSGGVSSGAAKSLAPPSTRSIGGGGSRSTIAGAPSGAGTSSTTTSSANMTSSGSRTLKAFQSSLRNRSSPVKKVEMGTRTVTRTTGGGLGMGSRGLVAENKTSYNGTGASGAVGNTSAASNTNNNHDYRSTSTSFTSSSGYYNGPPWPSSSSSSSNNRLASSSRYRRRSSFHSISPVRDVAEASLSPNRTKRVGPSMMSTRNYNGRSTSTRAVGTGGIASSLQPSAPGTRSANNSATSATTTSRNINNIDTLRSISSLSTSSSTPRADQADVRARILKILKLTDNESLEKNKVVEQSFSSNEQLHGHGGTSKPTNAVFAEYVHEHGMNINENDTVQLDAEEGHDRYDDVNEKSVSSTMNNPPTPTAIAPCLPSPQDLFPPRNPKPISSISCSQLPVPMTSPLLESPSVVSDFSLASSPSSIPASSPSVVELSAADEERFAGLRWILERRGCSYFHHQEANDGKGQLYHVVHNHHLDLLQADLVQPDSLHEEHGHLQQRQQFPTLVPLHKRLRSREVHWIALLGTLTVVMGLFFLLQDHLDAAIEMTLQQCAKLYVDRYRVPDVVIRPLEVQMKNASTSRLQDGIKITSAQLKNDGHVGGVVWDSTTRSRGNNSTWASESSVDPFPYNFTFTLPRTLPVPSSSSTISTTTPPVSTPTINHDIFDLNMVDIQAIPDATIADHLRVGFEGLTRDLQTLFVSKSNWSNMLSKTSAFNCLIKSASGSALHDNINLIGFKNHVFHHADELLFHLRPHLETVDATLRPLAGRAKGEILSLKSEVYRLGKRSLRATQELLDFRLVAEKVDVFVKDFGFDTRKLEDFFTSLWRSIIWAFRKFQMALDALIADLQAFVENDLLQVYVKEFQATAMNVWQCLLEKASEVMGMVQEKLFGLGEF
ncbi:unnamed protein product [Amoebophrya sp. A25]|nr:unnamed protein product [Amoebophrya sp. A25]|eukprot:GSA25T00020599001.1